MIMKHIVLGIGVALLALALTQSKAEARGHAGGGRGGDAPGPASVLSGGLPDRVLIRILGRGEPPGHRHLLLGVELHRLRSLNVEVTEE